MWKVKSEEGFTLLELIMVTVITGFLSSSLVLPFASSIKNGTRPEIYATATYLAVAQIEFNRSYGYEEVTSDVGTTSYTETITVGTQTRDYDVTIVIGYVTHSGSSFSAPVSSPSSEIIKVTVTISNSDIPFDVELWTILIKDNYDANPNT